MFEILQAVSTIVEGQLEDFRQAGGIVCRSPAVHAIRYSNLVNTVHPSWDRILQTSLFNSVPSKGLSIFKILFSGMGGSVG